MFYLFYINIIKIIEFINYYVTMYKLINGNN